MFIIEHVLPIISLVMADTVAAEATANPAHPDAALIGRLLSENQLVHLPVPQTPVDTIIDSYVKLGQGERDTMRLGLTTSDAPVVLDDYLAFVIATRFGLKPILLLDLIPSLVIEGHVGKIVAGKIVDQIAPRYSLPFVNHTRFKLEQIQL